MSHHRGNLLREAKKNKKMVLATAPNLRDALLLSSVTALPHHSSPMLHLFVNVAVHAAIPTVQIAPGVDMPMMKRPVDKSFMFLCRRSSYGVQIGQR